MTRILLALLIPFTVLWLGCDQQTEVAQEQTKTEFISQSTVIPDTPVPNTPMPTINPTKIEAPKIKKKKASDAENDVGTPKTTTETVYPDYDSTYVPRRPE